MKFPQLFSRRRARARRPSATIAIDMVSDWSTRDWADLPTHHPRQRD